ncbi:MAG: acyl transferase [Bacteroidia bacterium]|nr:acyl transferase [Bacteroidia bacterium]
MIKTSDIFNISSEEQFNTLALDVFNFQFEHNKVYRSFCDLLYKNPSDINRVEDIPFLPIQFFKSHNVVSTTKAIQQTFISSGTSSSIQSKHHIIDLSVYEESFLKGFQYFYGNCSDYVIIALLPSYLEREGSSLVYMVDHLIRKSNHSESGFYLNDLESLKSTLIGLEKDGKKTLLIGVSFALLDLIETAELKLNHCIVMETGGMKGRRKELIKKDLHAQLKKGFGVDHIHSEYGMTELLSQAYSSGSNCFKTPPWMNILIRDPEDAFTLLAERSTGGINVIDLANVNSCSFIATQDLGKLHPDGSFELLGRFDHSDIRGCNLMVL